MASPTTTAARPPRAGTGSVVGPCPSPTDPAAWDCDRAAQNVAALVTDARRTAVVGLDNFSRRILAWQLICGPAKAAAKLLWGSQVTLEWPKTWREPVELGTAACAGPRGPKWRAIGFEGNGIPGAVSDSAVHNASDGALLSGMVRAGHRIDDAVVITIPGSLGIVQNDSDLTQWVVMNNTAAPD